MKKLLLIVVVAGLSSNVIAAICSINGYTWTYTVSNGKATITDVSPKSGVNLIFPDTVDGYEVIGIDTSNMSSSCLGRFTGTLSLPKHLTTIGNYAFDGRGFTGPLIIPENVTTIGFSAFSRTGFTGPLTIPNRVTKIGGDAFYECSGFTGSTLTIGESVTEIGGYAFDGCGFVGSLIIPENVTTIGEGAFSRTGFTGSLKIPDRVTKIGTKAFYGCSSFTGALTIGDSVTSIGRNAFDGCSGFTGSLTIPDSVTYIGFQAFYGCRGLKNMIFIKSAPPLGDSKDVNGFLNSGLWGKKILYAQEYGAAWQKFLRDNDGLIYDAGYIQETVQTVLIVSSKIRETDPTVMDVVYKVTSSQPTVKVRALAFKDGIRSFSNVVRPETFIEGTDANIGDGIVPNVEHKLSWKVSADWQETLAKVKFEVLALDGELLPLEITTLTKTDSQPKMEISWNVMFASWVFDALMWLYADKDVGLILANGVLKSGDVQLVNSASVSMKNATVYVYRKMGYELLQGERLEYARQMLRRDLLDVSKAQYAVKVIEE